MKAFPPLLAVLMLVGCHKDKDQAEDWSKGGVPLKERLAAHRAEKEARKSEEGPLRRALFDCQHTLSGLRPALSIECIEASQARAITKELSKENIAGKVVLLQRDLEKKEAQVEASKKKNEATIKEARASIEAGHKFIKDNEVDPALAEEFQAWALYCERGIDSLLVWKKEIDDAARNRDHQLVMAGITRDFAPYDRAREHYQEVQDRPDIDLLGPPPGE